MAEVGLVTGEAHGGTSALAGSHTVSSESPSSSPGQDSREAAESLPPRRVSKGVSQSLPDVSGVGLATLYHPPRVPQEATFTPTAAGLRDPVGSSPTPPLDLQTFLSSAFSSFLAAGLQQATQLPPQPLAGHSAQQAPPTSSSHSTRRGAATAQADSDPSEDCPEDIEFSEDDDLPPDNPAFTGLFRPSLFKSLLHKARLTTNLGASGVDSMGAPSTLFFIPQSWTRTLYRAPGCFWTFCKALGASLGP